MAQENSTHFGFETVTEKEKTRKVVGVFDSVASNYDVMNDIMSMGVHRLWKHQFVHLCKIRKDANILDLAGGTGDIAFLMKKRLSASGSVTICDLNAEMLQVGRNRSLDKGYVDDFRFVQANAEDLPFPDNNFDCITIAFGLRNVTNKQKALESMYSKLKFGGQIMILEFSKVVLPVLDKVYNDYSFKVIPWFGKKVAKDEASYQYLVESIKMHPDQESLLSMMKTAGFESADYINLSGGIVAIHRGYKL